MTALWLVIRFMHLRKIHTFEGTIEYRLCRGCYGVNATMRYIPEE